MTAPKPHRADLDLIIDAIRAMPLHDGRRIHVWLGGQWVRIDLHALMCVAEWAVALDDRIHDECGDGDFVHDFVVSRPWEDG